MRKILVGIAITSALLLSAFSPAAGATDSENFKERGYRSLFDGQDLTEWKVPEGDGGHWKVMDGVIDYDAQSEAEGDKSLWTKEKFEDFKLHVEWRLKAHSGLYNMPVILPNGNYARGPDGNVIRFMRPNADSGILLKGAGQANIWCWGVGSGEIWSTRNNKDLPQEERARAVPMTHADNPVGRWNEFDITLKDKRVTVHLNDTLVINNCLMPGMPEKGRIGLQHHGGYSESGAPSGASSLVQYRNIWIKPIEPEPGFERVDFSNWETEGNWKPLGEGEVALYPRRGDEGWTRFEDYIWAPKQYGDFVIDLEFKIPPGGNSGVFFRVGDKGDAVDTGIEAQILDTHGKEDPGPHDCGGVIGTVGPSKNMAKPAGQWNHMRITCRGSRLQIELNGEQVVDVNLEDTSRSDRPPVGYVGFQDEGKNVHYRNVRIKELGSSAGE